MFRVIVLVCLIVGFNTHSFAVTTQERAALVALYHATGGESWRRNNTWLGASGSECDWYGVTCDLDGNIIYLTLGSNQLAGQIPPELGDLSQLQSLNFDNNQLTGVIPPELGSLNQLSRLVLSLNQLTGSIPAELGSLSQLTTLDLFSNQLSGAIPVALSGLTQLQHFMLSNNYNLTGPVPAFLSSLSQLIRVELDYNQLTGVIPPELGNLSQLQTLGLSGNQLTGEIPTELSNLSQLSSLSLRSNQLTGTIPIQLSHLSQLFSLGLDNNQLTGEIPPELGNLSQMRALYLADNQLTGVIPAELGNLSQLEHLTLKGNQLSGTIPDSLLNLPIRFLTINNNGCLTSDNQLLINFIQDLDSRWEPCIAEPTISVWAAPRVEPYPSDIAIIPGDPRFPARYQFILRDSNAQPMVNQQLTVSIANQGIARLESATATERQAGYQLELLTDAQGAVLVDYIFTGTISREDIFTEDTISVTHEITGVQKQAIVSVGLSVEVKNLISVEQDFGSFPRTLGLRIQIQDALRPDMDLRAYLSELEEVSGHQVGANVEIEWLNRPKPEMIDMFSVFVPNLANLDEPELYDSVAVINYGDNALTEVLVEAQDEPDLSIGPNNFPAIIFEDPGTYNLQAMVSPVILNEDGSVDLNEVKGAYDPINYHIFFVTINDAVESVLQSLLCSVKPTTRGQLAFYTFFIDNPWPLPFVPSQLAAQGTFKFMGALCDVMKGNYFTAAGNLATLRVDYLDDLLAANDLALTALEVQRLKNLTTVTDSYYRLSNVNDFYSLPQSQKIKHSGIAFKSSRLVRRLDLNTAVTAEELTEMYKQIIAAELAVDKDLQGWQIFGLINNGQASLARVPDTAQYYSNNGVSVLLMPPEANTLNIETSQNADIFRFYQANSNEVFTADYQFISSGINNLLNMNVLDASVQVDVGADGIVDTVFSPQINRIQTSRAGIVLSLSQASYHAGDELVVSISLENPGDELRVDGYFILVDAAGQVTSLPDFSVGLNPIVSHYVLPAQLDLPMSPILSVRVPEGLHGEFSVVAALTYPGTVDPVGGQFSMVNIVID